MRMRQARPFDGEHPVLDAAKSFGDHGRRQDPGGHAGRERKAAGGKTYTMTTVDAYALLNDLRTLVNLENAVRLFSGTRR